MGAVAVAGGPETRWRPAPRSPGRGPRSRARGLTWTAAPLLVLAGCGEPAPPPDRVLHLDPRLEDGRSPAEVLAGTSERVQEWTFSTPEDLQQSAWTPVGARFLEAEGLEGVALQGSETGPQGTRRVSLGWRGSLPAESVNVLELRLSYVGLGVSRLTWRRADDPPGPVDPERRVGTPHAEAREAQTLRLPLTGHPEWSGEITELRLMPSAVGTQRFVLHSLSLLHEGFAPGSSPTDEGREARAAGDGGLLATGIEARRCWPVDWGVPLYARDVRVPPGGRLTVETAVPAVCRTLDRELRFAVDARESDGASGDWSALAERAALPARDPGALSWSPLRADLSRFAGKEVDLRFRVWTDAGEGLDGELRRTRALWGEPIVFGDRPRDRRPNLLLVTIDTTRADAVGVYGGGGFTPFLDSLATEGILFENAWTASNSTTPSHASILTGTATQDHGLLDNWSILAAENRTLAESLREAGYHTAAAVSVGHLQPATSGLGQGFDRFLLARPGAPRDGRLTIEGVRSWLRGWSEAGDRPFFLWVHLFDPHTPYGPPQEFLSEYARTSGLDPPPRSVDPPTIEPHRYTAAGEFLEEITNLEYARWLYGASVAFTDRQVGELWRTFGELGLAEDTVFLVTSDHGESLGERRHWFHHTSIHDVVTAVPLILRLPGGPRGRRVEDLAWTLDIAPTLLELAGLPRASGMRGTSLLKLAEGRGRGQRRLWFEHADLIQVGCRDAQYHFIVNLMDNSELGPEHFIPEGARFLFDHTGDPGLDLAAERPQAVEELVAHLARWRASALDHERLERELTPEEQAELEALGYAGAGR